MTKVHNPQRPITASTHKLNNNVANKVSEPGKPPAPNVTADALFEKEPAGKVKGSWVGPPDQFGRPTDGQVKQALRQSNTPRPEAKQDLIARQQKVAGNYSYQKDLRTHLGGLKAGKKDVPTPVAPQPMAATDNPATTRVIKDEDVASTLRKAGLMEPAPGEASVTPQPIAQATYMSGDRNALCAALLFNPKATVEVLYNQGDVKDSRQAEQLKAFYVDALKSNGVDEATASSRVKLTGVENSRTAYQTRTETGSAVNLTPGIATSVVAHAFGKDAAKAKQTLEKAWIDSIPKEDRNKLDAWANEHLKGIEDHSVLVWVRQGGTDLSRRPELNMSEFALAQITQKAADVGKKAYLVGDPIGRETADKHPLMEFWNKMPEGLQDRTHQLYVMSKLRDKGCLMVGMRSGALEPHAMLGMPTLSIEGVSGGKRNDRLRQYAGRLEHWRPMETLSDLGEGAGPMRATRDDRRQLKSYINSSIDRNRAAMSDTVADGLKKALVDHEDPGKAASQAARDGSLPGATQQLVQDTADAIRVSNAMKSEIEQRQFQKEELDHLEGSLKQFFDRPS